MRSAGGDGGTLGATNEPFALEEEESPFRDIDMSKMPLSLDSSTFAPFTLSEAVTCSEAILGVAEAEDGPCVILGDSWVLGSVDDNSFLGIDWLTLELSKESPRFGRYCNCPKVGACADLEESVDPSSVLRWSCNSWEAPLFCVKNDSGS